MATLTVFGDLSDGMGIKISTSYATARGAGADTTVTNRTTEHIGQRLTGGTYECYQAGLAFDTSALGADAVISAAVLSLKAYGAPSAPYPQLEVRGYDWGSTYGTGDFIAGDSLSGYTLLATEDTTPWSHMAYQAFTNVAMPAYINKTGFTRFIIADANQRLNVAPTGTEFTDWNTADNTDTADDPKLVITYTIPTPTPNALMMLGVG